MISKQKHRSVRLPPQLESKVDEALERTGLSLSHLIRQALIEKFERDSNPTQSVTPMANSTEIYVSVEEMYETQMSASLGLNPFAYMIEGLVFRVECLTSSVSWESPPSDLNWIIQIIRAYNEQGQPKKVKVTVTKPTDYLGDIFHLNGMPMSRHRMLTNGSEFAMHILSKCKDQ